MSTQTPGTASAHHSGLLQRWNALLAPGSTPTAEVVATGRALLASWAQPHRRYHTVTHLQDVLDRVDE